MTWLQTNGGSKAATWLLCIVNLKREAPKSSLLSLKDVHPINHQANDLLKKKKKTFNKAKCPSNVSSTRRLNQY
jgi:hypothetical protein